MFSFYKATGQVLHCVELNVTRVIVVYPGSRGRHTGCFLILVFVMLILLSLNPVHADAVISTDKLDYSPGETVTIYGSGFGPAAAVTVEVVRPDGTVNPPSWSVTADGSGDFTTVYQLDGITGTYAVTATDGTNTATTTFTDAVLDHFGVTGWPSSVTAGSSFGGVVVTAYDASNNVITSYTASVWFTSTDGAAVLPATASSMYTFTGSGTGKDNGVHTFSGFTLNTPGSQTITVHETSASKTATSSTITVTAATLDHFGLTGYPSSVTAGTAFTGSGVVVTAYDASNHVILRYTGSVYFTSTDPQAVLPKTSTSKYTFTAGDNGVHTFVASGFTLKTTPSQTINVTDGSKSTTSSSITVNPAGGLYPDHMGLTGYPSIVAAGQNFDGSNVTVTAYDAYNNVKTDYRGNVWFTSTDGSATLPYTASNKYTFTAGDNGVHRFAGTTFTLRAVGSRTITVLESTASKSTTSSPITVNPADTTPPTTTASLTANGSPYTSGTWTKYDVAVSLTATDNVGGSGVKQITYSASGDQTIAPTTVSGSTASFSITAEGTTTVSFYATDNANNVETPTKTVTIKIDKTAPAVALTPDRAANAAGWYNASVTFAVSSPGSDLSDSVACDVGIVYSGPDSATASVTGHCTDAAGNVGSGSASFKYDSAAPVVTVTPDRSADSGEWYNHTVTFTATGTSTTSGAATCGSIADYSSPDSATASVSASCVNPAGNRGSGSASFKYDATAPAVALTPDRAANAAGWYNASVTFAVSSPGSDLSDSVACDVGIVYSGPDSATASVTGHCTDAAGNVGSGSASFKYDSAAPVVTVTPDRSADSGEWYNHTVTFTATGTSTTSGAATCGSIADYSSPDSATASVSASCVNPAGNRGSGSASFKYDATAPAVALTPDRAANAAGWYNASVTFAVSSPGSDLSDSVACDVGIVYSGPDSATASVTGHCTDAAGNVGSGSASFKYDSAAPVVTVTPDRSADSGEWYNHTVTFTATGTSTTSGAATCGSIADYSSPDSATASVSASCVNPAGNRGSGSASFKYDATAPAVALTPDRAANAAGWYNASVTFAVSSPGSDLSDSVACDVGIVYSGPDSATASVTGHCTDAAGNVGSGSASFKYDSAAPVVTVTPDRSADSGEWYNHTVTFTATGTSTTSGAATCGSIADYSSPDSATASVSASCVNPAGNRGSGSASFKYDATAPAVALTPDRAANAAGWYNASVTFAVSSPGSDLSDSVACDVGIVYSGPDSATASVTGHCTDAAGNVGSGSASFKYDSAAPVVTVTPDRSADSGEWYNHTVTFTATGTSTTSGAATCGSIADYSSPDSATASVSASCVNPAGNRGSGSASFKYDATAPAVALTPDRAANAAGWYNASVTFAVSSPGSDLSDSVACDVGIVYSGPDSATASVTGHCTDAAGNVGSGSASFKYDSAAPVVTVTPDRSADSGEWYNHTVTFTATGTSTTSGAATCGSIADYSSPDSATASVSASCVNPAGNRGSGSASFKYDATAPAVALTPDRAANAAGWYNASVTFAVSSPGSDLSDSVACDVGIVYSGPDSATASVTGHCTDAAGNVGSGSASFKYDSAAPVVTVTPDRSADSGEWYNHTVTFTATGTSTTSGAATCGSIADYSSPDSATASVSASCVNPAGNRGSGSASFKYDATAPAVALTPDRAANAAGWYNASVTFAVSSPGSDLSDSVACDVGIVYSGPDSATASVTGHCTDAAGNVGSGSASFKYDSAAPVVTVTPDRSADSGEWYNHTVTFTATGTSTTSGAATCGSIADYSSPDSATASVSASCVNPAGNRGSGSASFKYDATAPAITITSPSSGGTYALSQAVASSYACSDAMSTVDSCIGTAPNGSNFDTTSVGSKTFTVRATDTAGNSALVTVSYTVSLPCSIPIGTPPPGYTVVLGTSGNDKVTLGANTIFFGNGGNDQVVGLTGDHIMCMLNGNDQITTGPGNDIIQAGNGNKIIKAGDGNNYILAGTGNDQITTGSGDDYIDAGGGNNIINAGDGNNTVITGAGNDQITAGSGNDVINAGDGNNIVNAGDGNNRINTGAGNDQITTGRGNDIIKAGNGNNIVKAGAGDDEIWTGTGNDNIDGGEGYDVCHPGSGTNIVLNCESTLP